jgi:hypothetical protein
MSGLRSVALAVMSATSPIAIVAGSGIAGADTAAPGDACAVLRATTHDVNGRTMWCNPTMTGDHTLVWQYGGPSSS